MASNRRFKRLTKEEYAEAIEWYQQQSALWHLGYGEQLALLNSVSPHLYEGWLADVSQNLKPDLPVCVVSRLEILIGVAKSLDILAPTNRPDLATIWFSSPNDNPLFQGKSIKQYLLDNNDTDAFQRVEEYLVEAVIGGLSGSYL
jgi:hypothetical protein